jgi:transposase InsO family protein
MAHRNARLTPVTRWELVQAVAVGWPQTEVARQFRVSRATVSKWVERYRDEGRAGLEDRSSRPRRHPCQTPAALARQICALRRQRGFGPHRIAWALGIARSTVYAVLRRAGLNRLSQLHRVTREPVRRYEHPRPGDLLHIDVKKLGRIPPGGGKRFAPGFAETGSGPHSGASPGIDYLHVAVDDHSRYAYVEALPDERGKNCAAFLERAVAEFASRGVPVRRVLTDNAKAYTSHVFTGAARDAGIALKLTRPYRPQTNGKAERFIQTLQQEWAYARRYHSNDARLRELSGWLNHYNHQRPHGGIGGNVPASRL